MTNTSEVPSVRGPMLLQLDPTALRFSETTSQAERRRHFDKGALGELADSLKSLGMVQPVVARRVNGHYEVVAGERRVLAARQAKLDEKIGACVLKAIYTSPPKKLARADLELIAESVIDTAGMNDALEEAIGWSPTYGTIAKQLKKLSDAQLNAFLLLSAIGDNWRYSELKSLAPIAKRHGVDVEKIKRSIAAEVAPKKSGTTKAAKTK